MNLLHQTAVSLGRRLLAVGLFVTPIFAGLVTPVVSISTAFAAGPRTDLQLNFKDAEIDAVVGAFGHFLNKTFIIDPRVRGKITLETPRAVQPQEAYALLQTALRVQGFATVESGSIIRVVPEADAKLQPGPVSVGNTPLARGDAIVTQIFRLNYESASNMIAALRPLISQNNTITAIPGSNSLVITDYAANLQRLARIIATLDSPSTNEVEVVTVRHAVASDIAVMVGRLLDDTQRGAAQDPGQRVTVFADPRLNAVMIRAASAAKINLAKSLIARLDQPSTQPGNVNVVYLRNAEAVKLAEVLKSVLSGSDGGASVAARAAPQAVPSAGAAAAANQPGAAATASGPSSVTFSGGGATIAADATTNSLIITAPEAIYRNLRTVIDRLDTRRAQVYIESLIVEITSENAAEFGIQWQSLTKGGSRNTVIGGTNFGGAGAGNIVSAATNPASALAGGGLNVGVIAGGTPITIAGQQILNIGLLVRALETQSKVNILATPNLLTLDNEEARIVIGQNVPFITGQFAQTGGGAGASPFQTIERKDVGTTLRVKPQVSESGTVKLQIFQESSSLGSVTRPEGIITNRRAIESSVLVDDGQIVVLGGLIEDRVSGDTEGVPGLSSIPLLGNLFKYDKRKREKTNLLVFLRPVIIRSADNLYGVTSDRYDYMRQIQGDLRIPDHWLLKDSAAPVLPPMPPPPGADRPSGVEGSSISPSIRDARGAPIVPSLPTSRGSATLEQTKPNEVYIRLPSDLKDPAPLAPTVIPKPGDLPK